ncbi:MAG: PIN domain-containing protein [Deltaproteobacteria bacterium]|nr:PIN domain-containing protein [Deltaproteobacteria bacterium]
MIAVDTNILVYAHRRDSQFHTQADAVITKLAEGNEEWAIPWPCLHEFYAIVTHQRIYNPPTSVNDAIIQIECWLESPSLRLIGELSDYWSDLKQVLKASKTQGAHVHDIRIAAICLQHNVTALWSADRDFSRVPQLSIINPLIK